MNRIARKIWMDLIASNLNSEQLELPFDVSRRKKTSPGDSRNVKKKTMVDIIDRGGHKENRDPYLTVNVFGGLYTFYFDDDMAVGKFMGTKKVDLKWLQLNSSEYNKGRYLVKD